jgi:aldose 1-epimerase
MECGIDRTTNQGTELLHLTCREDGRNCGLVLSPSHGANVCRWTVDGRAVIDFDADLLSAHDYTGTPVLYPTPNRVRDGRFTFGDRLFQYDSPDRPAYEHGLVHFEIFHVDGPHITEQGVETTLWFDFLPGTAAYRAFPIEHRLTLKIRLTPDGFTTTFRIDNHDSVVLPFGFALHPYFMKLSGEDGTFVTLPAESYMETPPDLLPTGRLVAVDRGPCDLRRPVPVGRLDLDHVFTDLRPGEPARIDYATENLAIELHAGPALTHLVFYSPKGQPFFCIENQSCSTDTHNMHARGFVEVAGLKTVPPGGFFEDRIEYRAVRGSSHA